MKCTYNAQSTRDMAQERNLFQHSPERKQYCTEIVKESLLPQANIIEAIQKCTLFCIALFLHGHTVHK